MGLVVGVGGRPGRLSYALRSGFDMDYCYSSTVCQFSSHKIHHQSPRLFRQSWVVAVAVGHGESVTDAVEEVPAWRLAVGLKRRHQFLLHGDARDMVVAAEEYLRPVPPRCIFNRQAHSPAKVFFVPPARWAHV
jgi:hypothetical protein